MDNHNDLLLEYYATRYFLKAAVEAGLAQASVILADRETSLRQALEKMNGGKKLAL